MDITTPRPIARQGDEAVIAPRAPSPAKATERSDSNTFNVLGAIRDNLASDAAAVANQALFRATVHECHAVRRILLRVARGAALDAPAPHPTVKQAVRVVANVAAALAAGAALAVDTAPAVEFARAPTPTLPTRCTSLSPHKTRLKRATSSPSSLVVVLVFGPLSAVPRRWRNPHHRSYSLCCPQAAQRHSQARPKSNRARRYFLRSVLAAYFAEVELALEVGQLPLQPGLRCVADEPIGYAQIKKG